MRLFVVHGDLGGCAGCGDTMVLLAEDQRDAIEMIIDSATSEINGVATWEWSDDDDDEQRLTDRDTLREAARGLRWREMPVTRAAIVLLQLGGH